MLRLLLGKDWKALRREILAQIGENVAARQEGNVLIVPELISHEMERALCAAAGDTASRYAEVLSFSRLCRAVAEEVGSAGLNCLDNGGRVVAMAAAARQLSSRLKAYAALESKPEFLKELVDAVDEFKRCCISTDDLKQAAARTAGSLAQKLEELALLMESYDGLCAQGRRDPRDQMSWLLEQLQESDYGENHVFYIDGFPDFTRQNLAILEELICTSPMVTVALNCDEVDSSLLAFEKPGKTAGELFRIAKRRGIPVEVHCLECREEPLALARERLFQGALPVGAARDVLRTYRAENIWQETMAAAMEAGRLIRRGCRYRDITLVVTDMASYAGPAEMIFRRMGIPLYRAGTQDILRQSVVATVIAALEAADSDFEPKAMQRYLRSALSPLDANQCDKLENYVYLWSIREKQWLNPWTRHPDGFSKEMEKKPLTAKQKQQLEELNALRRRVAEPLERLRRNLSDGKPLEDQVKGLYRFLEELGMEQRLEVQAREMDTRGEHRQAQILNQLWEILVSALEQMYDVLGQTHWEPDQFQRLLRLLLSQYDVGTIPPVLDAVQMGPVSALRCHEAKHLLILGAGEGSFPGYSGSKGVLTDQERMALRKLNVQLTGGAEEGIQEEFAEIYGVLCGAEQSVAVFCSADQPSYLFSRLSELCGGPEKADVQLEFALTGRREAGAWFAQQGLPEQARALGVEAACNEILSRQDYRLGSLKRKTLEGLYGRELRLSASQVDTQAECRLLYFLKYGLKARERKPAQVDPAEFGTFVHAVLEDTVRQVRKQGGFHTVSLEQTQSIARESAERYRKERFSALESARVQTMMARNQRELTMIVEELWRELHEGQFQPVGEEVSFGEDGLLPWIQVPSASMKAALQGKIDRVDAWQGPGSPYFRVVDYKTGRKSFDLCDVTQGVGLQMLLYLFALEHSGDAFFGKRCYPAGVEYFPARAPYLSVKGDMDAPEVEKKRRKEWQRSGMLLDDSQILEAMEPENGEKKVLQDIFRADREQLRKLESYVFGLLTGTVNDIASGDVTPNPYTRGTAFDPCTFCPYGPVCHPEQNAQRRNFERINEARFWETVGKEEEHHG